MMKRSLLFISFFLYTSFLLSQVRFYAESNATEVVQGATFIISFNIENGTDENFQPPSFQAFDVLSGPNLGQSITIINGRRSQSLSYSYRLLAKKVGTFTIDEASIDANNQKLKTEPLTIKVVAGRKPEAAAQSGNDQILIRPEINYDTAYLGQQITLKYVMYRKININGHQLTSIPEFKNFFVQQIPNYREKVKLVVIEGEQYAREVLRAIILYPQQAGRQEIEPATFNITLRGRSIFDRRTVVVPSEGVSILVKNTPVEAPDSFSGAVGDYYLGTQVKKQSITMDDAVTLELQVTGYGDGNLVQAPKQPFTDLFEIYEPNLIDEKLDVVKDRVRSTKTYEYLMVPQKTGKLAFTPELTYFDVDSAKYITIYSRQFKVNVMEGSNKEQRDLAKEEISFNTPIEVTKVTKVGATWAFSPVHLGLNGLLLLGGIGLYIKKKKRDEEENVDPMIKRNQRAQKIAIEKLSNAKTSLDKGELKEYYIQLREGLQNYLLDKTNHETAQLSKDQIAKLLQENDLNTHKEAILEIFTKGEQAIYASIAPGNEVADYDKTINIIKAIELQLNQ